MAIDLAARHLTGNPTILRPWPSTPVSAPLTKSQTVALLGYFFTIVSVVAWIIFLPFASITSPVSVTV